MRWQQKLRLGIAVFGVGFVVFLFFAMRPSKPRDEGPAKVTRVDRTAAAESTSGEIRRFGVSVENFRVEYDKAFTYPDGRQKLTGAKVFVDKRAGRNFKVSANEADVAASQDDVKMRGNVELTSSDGMLAKTEEASYSQKEGIVRAPGAAMFSHDKVSGRSIGLTYDEKRDVLWLLDQAVVKMLPETPKDEPIDIEAGAAGFARADHYVRYDRGFKLTTGPRVLTSDTAMAYLDEAGKSLQTLEMRGNGKVAGVGAGAGALRLMEAAAINLEFAPDGRTLKGATLATEAPGRASVDLGTPESGDRRVSGHWIDIRFAEDGSTVSSLTVRDEVRLDLPASGTDPLRAISSALLLAKGEPGKALNAAKFSDNVEYREQRPDAAPRVVRSRVLDLSTAPGLGAIENAHFTGAVRFEEDKTRAASGDVKYLVGKGVVQLDGVDDSTGLAPRVTDGQVTIDAKQIEMVLDKNTISAKQDVRSTMVPVDPQAAAKDAPHRAGMLKQDQPVYAMAATLNYDSGSRLAVYQSGGGVLARLWQGDTTIMGETITVDDATGNLMAKGKVASTLMLDPPEDKAPPAGAKPAADAKPAPTTKEAPADRTPTVASAVDLVYEDAQRRAVYTGNAHVAGPQGDLKAARVELYLKAGGSELERVEGYQSVSMRDKGREATGDRLTFFNADGRYRMVGNPVKLLSDCKETTGRALTFYKANSRIEVDPTDELRTQTKPVPGCVAPVKSDKK